MRWRPAILLCLLAGCTSGPDLTGHVEGTALVGPTCPVESDPPEPGCEDKPYQGGLVLVRSPQGTVAASFPTRDDGSFRVGAPPGDYEIRSPSGATLPACSSPPFAITANAVVRVEVTCDSGIR